MLNPVRDSERTMRFRNWGRGFGPNSVGLIPVTFGETRKFVGRWVVDFGFCGSLLFVKVGFCGFLLFVKPGFCGHLLFVD